MKLSELVHLRSQLDALSPAKTADIISQHLNPVIHLIESSEIKFPALENDMHQGYQNMQASLFRFHNVIHQIRDQIELSINNMQPAYHAASYKLYESGNESDDADYILNRRPTLSETNSSLVRGRMLLYSHWRQPGMIIRPGLEPWVRDLVALDPLYLVDTSYDLVRDIIDGFPVEYQRRLRTCVVHENSEQPLLARIPDNQLGYVLVYNFFAYRPLELIRRYMQEIFVKLAPGGVMAMSFNDCDRVGGVLLTERNFACYQPVSLIVSAAKTLGFEISYQYHLDDANTWLELTRPGQYTSLRGGQALSVINRKSIKKND